MNKALRQILLPSLIVATLLIIAIFPIEVYRYYILLRWVVFLTAIYIGVFSYEAKKIYWTWIMGIIAIIFNPIIPFHLSKDIWTVIDLIAAITFGITIFILKEKKSKSKRGEPTKKLRWRLFLWILLVFVILLMFYLASLI